MKKSILDLREESFPPVTDIKKEYTSLLIWQRAHEFVLGIYEFSRRFPKDESQGLTDQIRSSAVNITSNIAQSLDQSSPGEKIKFLGYAMSSLAKCKYYQLLCKDLKYGQNKVLEEKLEEVEGLIRSSIKNTRNNLSLGF